MFKVKFWIHLSICLMLSIHAIKAQPKKDYHLFRSTPDSLLREMTTDRPDITETAYTVDAGRLQFELDLFQIFRHPIEFNQTEVDYLFLNGFARIGLTHRTELQFQFSAWQMHFPQLKQANQNENEMYQGIGDIGLRYKYNIKGNDKEGLALAIMPSLLIPLRSKASEGYLIPGINFIYEKEIAAKFDIGGQIEYHQLYTPDFNFKSDETWLMFLLGREISPKLDWFVESANIFSNSNAPRILLNSGLIYKITPNLFLDIAVQYGLNRFAHQSVFTGFAYRL
jgi:hypothetical protein